MKYWQTEKGKEASRRYRERKRDKLDPNRECERVLAAKAATKIEREYGHQLAREGRQWAEQQERGIEQPVLGFEEDEDTVEQGTLVDHGPVSCPDMGKAKDTTPCSKRGSRQACKFCSR
jgi:hypothetical protein